MAQNCRSSSRSVRVPLKFGDSIYNHNGKKMNKNGVDSNQNSHDNGENLGKMKLGLQIQRRMKFNWEIFVDVNTIHVNVDEPVEGDSIVNMNGNENMNSDNNGDRKTYIKSYANMVKQNDNPVDNKLSFRPTKINEDGSEFVIFDKALVQKGSQYRKLIV
ncbi:hypothetical protein Tco_1492723 [Tanacetum coccineum]